MAEATETTETETTEEAGTEETTETPPAPTVESLSSELTTLRAALAKANRDAERNRRKAAETPPADEAAAAAEKAAADKWKPAVVRTAARAAFAEAGLAAGADALPKVLRMLDLDDLTVDDEGEVAGLAEQIAEIKATVPALFTAAKPVVVRAPKVSASDKPNGASDKPQSSAARLFAAAEQARRAG